MRDLVVIECGAGQADPDRPYHPARTWPVSLAALWSESIPAGARRTRLCHVSLLVRGLDALLALDARVNVLTP